MRKLILAICLFLSMAMAYADASVFQNTPYQVCFTPGENCTNLIVHAIAEAKKSIYLRAYAFTSRPIRRALIAAKKRGVIVELLLDESQSKNHKPTQKSLQAFVKNKIPVWVNQKKIVEHNKVMIIDDALVITGSYNYTRAAQEKNAENLLIIHDVELAKKYLAEWNKMQTASALQRSIHK